MHGCSSHPQPVYPMTRTGQPAAVVVVPPPQVVALPQPLALFSLTASTSVRWRTSALSNPEDLEVKED